MAMVDHLTDLNLTLMRSLCTLPHKLGTRRFEGD
jgi:hypothetical protein